MKKEESQLQRVEQPNAVAIREENAQQLMRRATDVAGVCREIVLKTACNIQGKKYVKCEGWMSIATAHGCIASSRDVEKVEGGWKAIGEIKRISDGLVLASAEGFVGVDETNTWGKRPEYACRAMAQTRAISRACRAAFAHVVVMMDAGLSTTPAEEVPDGGFDAQRPPSEPISPPRVNAGHSDRPPQGSFESVVDGDEKRDEVMFDDYKRVTSKPDAKKPWTAWFCTFSTDSGSTFEAGTFDDRVADKLDILKGQPVIIRHRAGKKPGTRELLSIEPQQDDIPT